MSDAPPTEPRRPLRRALLAGALLGGLLVVLWEAAYILVGSNLREVVPGAFYRCAQPTPADLAHARDRYGVRTVLALRGVCDFEAWYRDEVRAAEGLGLSMEVLTFSAGRLPSVPAVRRLCQILDDAEPPLLVHCQRGVDRTGLVATLYLLLKTDATLDEARGQLSLRYLHINAGRTRAMGRFLDLYAAWLDGQGEGHRPELLRHYLLEVYRPPHGYGRIELLSPPAHGEPLRLERDEPTAIPVRVWNDSGDDLPLSPGLLGGPYLRWHLSDANRKAVDEPRPGGLREVRVPPGGSADLCVYLPALKTPGRYHLMIDLFEGLVGSFAVYGSDPLFVELDVP